MLVPNRFRTGTIETVDNDHGMLTLWLKYRGQRLGLLAEQRYMCDALVGCLGLEQPWEGRASRFKADGQMLLALAPVRP